MPFPNSPLDGAVYTDPATNRIYTYSSANSIWTVKERKKLEDFTSTAASTPTPSDGDSLVGDGGSDYAPTPGISGEYQPISTSSQSIHTFGTWRSHDGTQYVDLPAGSITSGTWPTTLAGRSIDTTGQTTLTQNILSTPTNIGDHRKTTQWITPGTCYYFSFKYTGTEECYAYTPRFLKSSNLSGRTSGWYMWLFRGDNITSISEIGQQEAKEGYLGHAGGSAWTNSGFFNGAIGGNYYRPVYMYPGDVFTMALACSRLATYSLPMTYYSSGSGITFNTTNMEIVNGSMSTPYNYNNAYRLMGAGGNLPWYFAMSGTIRDAGLSETYRQLNRPVAGYFRGDDAVVHHNQTVEIFNGLPTPDFPSFMKNGKMIYDTATSSAYYWESATSSWRAI